MQLKMFIIILLVCTNYINCEEVSVDIINSTEFRNYSGESLRSQLKIIDDDVNLRFGDILQCQVVERNEAFNIIKVNTSSSLKYDFYTAPRQKRFSFKVQSDHDVFIVLSSTQNNESPTIEFNIGCCWDKSRLLLRLNGSLVDDVTIYDFELLNNKIFKEYWLSWNDGFYKLGYGKYIQNISKPILYRKIYTPYTIKYIGIRTSYGSNGTWILKGLTKDSAIDSERGIETKCLIIDSYGLTAKIKLQKELLGQLLRNFKKFKKIENISEDYIKKSLSELDDIYEKSTNLNDEILLSFIDDMRRLEYLKENIYGEIKRIYFMWYKYIENEIEFNSKNLSLFHKNLKTKLIELIQWSFNNYYVQLTTNNVTNFNNLE